MLDRKLPKQIDGDRVNDFFDEALLLFKKHEINLTNDLNLTLELVQCLGCFLENSCGVKITDEIHPHDAVIDILQQEVQALTEEGNTFH